MQDIQNLHNEPLNRSICKYSSKNHRIFWQLLSWKNLSPELPIKSKQITCMLAPNLKKITSVGLAFVSHSKNIFVINLKQFPYISLWNHIVLLFAFRSNTLLRTLQQLLHILSSLSLRIIKSFSNEIHKLKLFLLCLLNF